MKSMRKMLWRINKKARSLSIFVLSFLRLVRFKSSLRQARWLAGKRCKIRSIWAFKKLFLCQEVLLKNQEHLLVSKMSIGVPIKILHEAEGHIVTLETMTGEVYRGKLVEAEDNMNCQMSNTTVTARDGRVSQLEQVFIRGSKIRFLILPDMLKNAPMFKKMTQKGSGGSGAAGRGKSAILRAQGIILSLSVAC